MIGLYEVVEVLEVIDVKEVWMGDRLPKKGDRATVLHIYKNPLAYELECVYKNGKTKWLDTFTSKQLKLQAQGVRK